MTEQRPSIPLANQGPGSSATALLMDDRQQNFISHSTSIQTPTNTSERSTSVPFATDAMIVDFPQSNYHEPPSFVPSPFTSGKHSLVAHEDPRQTLPQLVPSFGHAEKVFDSPINLPGPNPIWGYNRSVVPHFQDGFLVPLQSPARPRFSYLPGDYPKAPSSVHLLTSSRMEDSYMHSGRERVCEHDAEFPNKRIRTDHALPDSNGMPLEHFALPKELPDDLWDLIFGTEREREAEFRNKRMRTDHARPDSNGMPLEHFALPALPKELWDLIFDVQATAGATDGTISGTQHGTKKKNYLKPFKVFQRRWFTTKYGYSNTNYIPLHTLISDIVPYQAVSHLCLAYPAEKEEHLQLLKLPHLETIKELELDGWDEHTAIDCLLNRRSSSLRSIKLVRLHMPLSEPLAKRDLVEKLHVEFGSDLFMTSLMKVGVQTAYNVDLRPLGPISRFSNQQQLALQTLVICYEADSPFDIQEVVFHEPLRISNAQNFVRLNIDGGH
ncbi:hypothetical protein BT69DRAFT_1333728 [Atractiella rhizophila]|nr:hypothetical protein BT69DRAFT_1333728 [Atractiella rhizophila]